MPDTLPETIAREVGVSRRTVLRVLNGEMKDTRPTIVARAKRIRERADELGYRPNLSAQTMRSGKFQAIGYVVAGENEGYPMAGSGAVAASICEALSKRDYRLAYSYASLEAVQTGHLPDVMRYSMVDALIMDRSGLFTQALFDAALKLDLPYLAINHKQPNNAIYPDDFAATREATRRLLEAGHRRILYFAHSFSLARYRHYSSDDRQAGYEAAMREAGLTPVCQEMQAPHDTVSPPRGAQRLEAFKAWMKGPEAPTAGVTYGAADATEILMAAHQFGLSVPQDFSVTTVHRGVVCAMAGGMHISGSHFSDFHIGALAAERVLWRLANPGKEFPSVVIPPHWHQGDTFGPAPA